VTMGQYDNALRGISWGIDWLVKAHITASDTPSCQRVCGTGQLTVDDVRVMAAAPGGA